MENTTSGFLNFMYLHVLLCVEDQVDRNTRNAENRRVIYVHNRHDLERKRIESYCCCLIGIESN